jgi:hypothetical protein
MKAKILGNHREISDDDLPFYEKEHKWHYELNDGDIVDVNMSIMANSMEGRNTPEGMCYLCKHHGRYEYLPVTWLDIDFSEKDIDWEQRLYEISNAKLASMPSDTNSGSIRFKVKLSIEYANELVKQLMDKYYESKN